MSQATRTGGEAIGSPALDELFTVLSNRRRRFALHYLRQAGGEAPLGELAEHVAAWENEVPLSAVTAAERKRAYTALQQLHLPTMDEYGLVRYDARAGTVALSADRRAYDAVLAVLRRSETGWGWYHLLLTSLGVLVLGSLRAHVYPVTALGPFGWLTLLVVASSAFSVFQVAMRRRARALVH